MVMIYEIDIDIENVIWIGIDREILIEYTIVDGIENESGTTIHAIEIQIE
jgi:hypothetical protein